MRYLVSRPSPSPGPRSCMTQEGYNSPKPQRCLTFVLDCFPAFLASASFLRAKPTLFLAFKVSIFHWPLMDHQKTVCKSWSLFWNWSQVFPCINMNNIAKDTAYQDWFMQQVPELYFCFMLQLMWSCRVSGKWCFLSTIPVKDSEWTTRIFKSHVCILFSYICFLLHIHCNL